MKKIWALLAASGVAFLMALSPMAVSASSVFDKGCEQKPDSPICQQTNNSEEKVGEFSQDLVSTLLLVLGIICTIVIIVGGIKYATSDGDSNKIASAKNTILYAVVGLVVAILAFGIVRFVLDAFSK